MNRLALFPLLLVVACGPDTEGTYEGGPADAGEQCVAAGADCGAPDEQCCEGTKCSATSYQCMAIDDDCRFSGGSCSRDGNCCDELVCTSRGVCDQ